MLSLILMVFAFVLFVVASFNPVVEPWRWRLAMWGLACLALVEIFAHSGVALK